MSVAEDLKNMPPAEADAKDRDRRKRRARWDREIRRELDAEEYGPIAEPEILSLRIRRTRERTAQAARISGLQMVGHRVLLAAQYKAGKTTMAANVIRSLLDGDPFLGAFSTTPITGALALFDFEMDPDQLDDWLIAQRISNDDRCIPIPMRGLATGFNIVDAARRAHWATLLRDLGVTYLILDCLRPVLDAIGLDEHSEAGFFLTKLDELLREAGIREALVIQHMGHKGEHARGDSRLLDWPDVGWTLVRQAEDDPASPRFFKAYGRGIDVRETQVQFNPDTQRLVILGADDGGGSRANVKRAAAVQAVVDFVKAASSPPSGRGIEGGIPGMKAGGFTQKEVRAAIQEAVKIGALSEEPGPRNASLYRLTAGKQPDFVLSGG